MRIVGGRLRGLKLAEVGAGDADAHLRPTTDRVREAIFNLLTNGAHAARLEGARVLDLFAGSGALGLEALSRGAARVAFVDDGAAAALGQGRSLLPAGVTAVSGRFGRGDPVSVRGRDGVELARGLVRYSAEEARAIAGHS